MVQVHCVAHRGALAIGDAAKNAEYTDIQEESEEFTWLVKFANSMYYHFFLWGDNHARIIT